MNTKDPEKGLAGQVSDSIQDLVSNIDQDLVEAFGDEIGEASGMRLIHLLDRIVNIVARVLPRVSLALVAWDDEAEEDYKPLATVFARDTARCPFWEHPLFAAREIVEGEWLPLSGNGRFTEFDDSFRTLGLVHRGIFVGCLVAWFEAQSDDCSKPQFVCVSRSAPLIAAMVQSAKITESLARQHDMSALLQGLLEISIPQENDWKLQWLAVQLRESLQADGVTILLEEEGVLLPAASTSPGFADRTSALSLKSLGQGPIKGSISYVRGQGLTGWVYEHCRSLRIEDDQEVVRRRLGIERLGPSHLDCDGDGPIVGHFLGVPLRFGGRIIGVIRLSRRSGLEPFTSADEKALQFFGDLLGAVLGNWQRVHQASSILESISESISVSRRWPSHILGASDPDQIIFANPGIATLLGRSREEVEALAVPAAYAPGEYERLLPHLRRARKAAEQSGRGEFGPVRSIFQRKDGSTVPVSISFRIQSNPLVRPPTYYTVAIARDLSSVEQLAKQHERFLAFLDALGVAYFRSDMSGNTIEATDSDARITGYTQEDWRAFKRTVLYEKGEDRVKLWELLRQSGGKLTRHLLGLRRKGGEPFWAEADLRLIQGQSEAEAEMEGFYRDVTPQMKVQRFLNEKEDRLIPPDELFARLKQATEFQVDYTSTIGHQIQTPLGALLGTIENLERGVIDPRQFRSSLRRVIGQLRACSRLVRNLSYMDMVLRRERIRIQQIKLRKLIHETERDFTTALAGKTLSLAIDMESIRRHLDIVYGHPELLRQVFANLVDNAIKYSYPHAAIYIRASVASSGPALDFLNRGLPIPPEERERIFERGVRSQRARALIPHGTGLGLWLVREILSLHRAKILCLEVEEDFRIYNCFRIVFPSDTPPDSSSVRSSQ